MNKELQHRFEDLIAYISATNDAVLNGDVQVLEVLDRTVETLCQDTLSTDAVVAKNMQPLMAETISRLDELEQNLEAFKKQQKGAEF